MKCILLNGSPKGKVSDTMKMSNSFVKGIEKACVEKKQDFEIEIIDTISLKIAACKGCYGCWRISPGKCIQNDDMTKVFEKFCNADLIIWSTPLYCYSFPSNLKVIIDRLLPISTPAQAVDANGETYHPSSLKKKLKNILISGSGFPDVKGNFDGLDFQFRKMFGASSQAVFCSESPMFNIKEAAPLAEPRLAIFEKAGYELINNGKVTEETIAEIAKPMMDPDAYRSMCSQNAGK